MNLEIRDTSVKKIPESDIKSINTPVLIKRTNEEIEIEKDEE